MVRFQFQNFQIDYNWFEITLNKNDKINMITGLKADRETSILAWLSQD